MCVCVCVSVSAVSTVISSPIVTQSPELMGGVNLAAAVAISVVLLLIIALVIGGVVVGAVIHMYLRIKKHDSMCYQ